VDGQVDRGLAFLVPGPLDTPTGGFVYDKHVIAGCRAAGLEPRVLVSEGAYPEPDDTTRRHVADLLTELPDGTVLVIDGLGLTGLAAVLAPHTDRLVIVGLIHHPLSDETALSRDSRARWIKREAAALRLTRGVFVTSHTTARRVSEILSVPMDRIRTVSPGVEDLPDLAFRHRPRPHGPVRLLSVGTLIPRKGHDVLIGALAELKTIDWHLEIIGAARDAGHASSLKALIGMMNLSDRIALRGAVDQNELDIAYRNADLFVLASRHEGYGIAYGEAVRWGLPVVGTTAGAIPEAVPEGAGRLVPPDDRDALRDLLGDLLNDPEKLAGLASGARAAASGLQTWTTTGAVFAEHIKEIGSWAISQPIG
jgi:glycosyltransferase involved in cell wall biosynthesis